MGTNLHDRDIGHNFPHWHYYLNLEKDLTECLRYVEPVEQQFDVYSDEFARIILLAASGFENSLKELIEVIGKNSKGNLQTLREPLISEFPSLVEMEFYVPRCDIVLKPLGDWESGKEKNPDWWKNGYVKIKHDKTRNPESASLRRAFDSVAALQLMLLYLYKKKYNDPVLPITLAPNLIQPRDISTSSYWDTGIITWEWRLPDYPVMQTE